MGFRRAVVWFLGASMGACLWAGDPAFLLRVERRDPKDLEILRAAGVPVTLESTFSLFAEGDGKTLEALRDLGYRAEAVDSSPRLWRYVQVGLRPDSELSLLERAGVPVFSEENWVLLRLWPDGERWLQGGPFFPAPVSHEPLAVPSPMTGGEEPRAPLLAGNVLVQRMVNQVSHQNIDATWGAVVPPNPPGTGTRYTTTAGCGDEAAWAQGVFQGYGLETAVQNYRSGYAPNVVATLPGAFHPEERLLVTAHLDDMPSTGYAPGADDNGSGSVTVLEAARVMSCYSFDRTVKFVLFTGEETGLEGSTAYASAAAASGEKIVGVLNLDMPGWQGDGSPSPENLDLNYNAASAWLGLHFAAAAQTYGTGLAVDAFLCPSLTASDHYPFWQRGYAAVCGITDNEGYCSHGGHYPYYHTSNDTIANCGNPGFFYSVVRATVAALADLAGPFKVAFSSPSFPCQGTGEIVVGDRDLNTDPSTRETVTVSLHSGTEPVGEAVTLLEETADSPFFRGSFQTSTAPPVHGDGKVSVQEGDTLTAEYQDSLDCNGATGVLYTATAAVDCRAPAITAVSVSAITESTALVTWTTDEPATSRVLFGTAFPPSRELSDPALVTAHSVLLTGLSPCTRYLVAVSSTDAAGNTAEDDNGGLGYPFRTTGRAYAFGPDDVEGATSWTPTGPWHVSTCRAFSGSKAWKAGATACPGTYGNSLDVTLTSPVLDLGAPGHGYRLRFREWYETEEGWDFCNIQVSVNGGATWTNLRTGLSGSSGGWVLRDLDLAPYSGSAFRVRFLFHSDSNTVAEGWYLDDLEVSRPEACPPDPLTCSASASPLQGYAPLAVSFSGQAVGGTPPYGFRWLFGDGTPDGSGPSTSHTYAAPGTYTARLQVTDGGSPPQSATSAPLILTVRQALMAQISALPLRGPAPLAVSFSASASGGLPPYDFAWNFGDGSPEENGPTPSHLFPNPGSYTVRLRTTDSDTPANRREDTLVVVARTPLSAAAAVQPPSGVAPLEVSCAAEVSGGVPPYLYLWTFGDGASSTEAAPSHTYSQPGTYDLHLAVSDSDTPPQTAEPSPVPVVVLPSVEVVPSVTPAEGHAPLQVRAEASASGGIPPYTFTWSFGDGTQAQGPAVDHTYTAPGSFPVSLQVRDSAYPAHETSAGAATVVVHPPLEASATVLPAEGVLPLTATFTAAVQGGLPPYAVSWDPGDGSPPLEGSPATHTYTAAGRYIPRLTVSDSATAPATVQRILDPLTVVEPLALSLAATPSAGVIPFTATCTASASGGLPPYTFAWSFGDGSQGSGNPASHEFTRPGSYQVVVSAADALGLTAEARSLVVAAAPLGLSASANPLQGGIPLTVHFQAVPSGGLGPVSVQWDFGDGSSAEGGDAVHTYDRPGVFRASATARDTLGQTASASLAVTAVTPPSLTAVRKKTAPFRLVLDGAGFQPGARILLGGSEAPETVFKSTARLQARGGAALKALLPKGQAVNVTVVNPDGGASAPLPFTR